MLVEFIVFFILLYAFIVAAGLHRYWLRLRDRRRGRWVAATLDGMAGRPVEEALTRFGIPFEVIEGTGRRFYVWKSPPSRNFPAGSGLLIVNVITDAGGEVMESSWHTR